MELVLDRGHRVSGAINASHGGSPHREVAVNARDLAICVVMSLCVTNEPDHLDLGTGAIAPDDGHALAKGVVPIFLAALDDVCRVPLGRTAQLVFAIINVVPSITIRVRA